MNIRRSERIIMDLTAEILIGEDRLASSIENLSNDGAYVVTAPAKNVTAFSSDTLLELKFSFPSGEKQVLHCKVKWSYLTPPRGFTNSVGLEIIDPPQTYTERLKSLQ